MASFADTLTSQIATAIAPVTGGSGDYTPSSPAPSAPAPSTSAPPPPAPSAAPPAPPAATPAAPSSSPHTPPAPASQPGSVPPPPSGTEPGSPGAAPAGVAAEVPFFNPDEPFEFPDEVSGAPATPPATRVAPAPTEGAPNTPPAGTLAPSWDDAAAWADQMPDAIREKLLQDPRGRQIYQAYKTTRELERPPELDENGVNVGGLGFRPSVDQIREMHSGAADLELMTHHFASAHTNPTYASDWIQNWFGQVGFGLGNDGKPTPGALAIAQNLMQSFNTIHPDFYRAVAMPAWFNYLNERYNSVHILATDEDRARALNATIDIESDLTGMTPEEIMARRGITDVSWRVPQPGQPQPTSTQPQHNPLQNRVQQLEQQIRERDNAQARQYHENWMNSLNGQLHNNLGEDINAVLKPLAEYYGPESIRYSAMYDRFFKDVVERIGDPDSNPAFRKYIVARDRSRASGDPRDMQAATKLWRDTVRPVVRELRTTYLQDAGGEIISRSQQRHQTLADAATRTSPASVAQTTPPVNQQKSLREQLNSPRPGESFEDVLKRLTRPLIEQAA